MTVNLFELSKKKIFLNYSICFLVRINNSYRCDHFGILGSQENLVSQLTLLHYVGKNIHIQVKQDRSMEFLVPRREMSFLFCPFITKNDVYI